LIFNKLYSLNEIGEKEEARMLIYHAYHGSLMANQLVDAKAIKEYVQDRFNIFLTESPTDA
jgi:hypothetical protein